MSKITSTIKRGFGTLMGFKLCKRCNRYVSNRMYRTLNGLCTNCHYSEQRGKIEATRERI